MKVLTSYYVEIIYHQYLNSFVCGRLNERMDFPCLFDDRASRVLVKCVINATALITPRLERHSVSSPRQAAIKVITAVGYIPKAIIMRLNLHLFIASLQDGRRSYLKHALVARIRNIFIKTGLARKIYKSNISSKISSTYCSLAKRLLNNQIIIAL